MRPTAVLVPAVIANLVVWWIYLAGTGRGFPWPLFVTIASVAGLVVQYQRGGLTPESGRQRNRDRNRGRNRDR